MSRREVWRALYIVVSMAFLGGLAFAVMVGLALAYGGVKM